MMRLRPVIIQNLSYVYKNKREIQTKNQNYNNFTKDLMSKPLNPVEAVLYFVKNKVIIKGIFFKTNNEISDL